MAGGKWHSVMGIEVLLEQGYRRFELWTGRRYPRSVASKAVLAAYLVSGWPRPLLLSRVKLDAAHHRKKGNDEK